jgi:hypothetical protein
MPIEMICQQLRMLAARLQKQWAIVAEVIDYSQLDYVEVYRQERKIDDLIQGYHVEAGWLIFEAFQSGAFCRDYSLCSIIGNFRRVYQYELRQPHRRRYIRGDLKRYIGYSVFQAVSRHWIAHPRRGIDKIWRHRYLNPAERYEFVCTTLASYLELAPDFVIAIIPTINGEE